MQPLKRFTQCGSLTMLFTVFIVLFGVSSTALTTFGKISPNSQPQPTPPPAKGRACNSHSECATLESTSCVRDPSDVVTRCLCGDNTAPINGQCSADYKGLRHMCSRTSECAVGMICSLDNSTSSGFGKLIGAHTNVRQCLCDEQNGYEENIRLYTCNSGVQIITNILMPLTSIIISYFVSSPISYITNH